MTSTGDRYQHFACNKVTSAALKPGFANLRNTHQLEYADEVTLGRSIVARVPYEAK